MRSRSLRMKGKLLLIERFSKLKRRYWLVVRSNTIEYKETFSIIYLPTSTTSPAFRLSYFHNLKIQSFLNTYKSFIFFFDTFFVFQLLWNTYNQIHYHNGYLIRLPASILSKDSLFVGLSSSFVIGFFLLSFVIKLTAY